MASGICSKRSWPPATASVATPLAGRETPSCRKCRQGRQAGVKAELAAHEQAILSGIQFATLATRTTNSDTLGALLLSSASLAARRLRQADWGADDHDQADQGQADPPGHTPCQTPKAAAPRPNGTDRLACGRRLEAISWQSPPASGEPD